MSFQDALWALVKIKFKSKRKLHFLVPDFYCSTVLDNIRARGHRYTYYPLNSNFQISSSKFSQYLWVHRPDIVVIFHPFGITSELISDQSWVQELPGKSLIVEDCAHCLINPDEIQFINTRHFLIDSLRKTCPFQGARIFSKQKTRFTNRLHRSNPKFNRIKYFFSFMVFRIHLWFSYQSRSNTTTAPLYRRLINIYDQMMGTQTEPEPGFSIVKRLVNRINYPKVKNIKSKQVDQYLIAITSLKLPSNIYVPTMPKSDYARLTMLPLCFVGKPPRNLISQLRSQSVDAQYQFSDSPWNHNRRVLALPLGFHVTDTDIINICKILGH
jgi:hypothetical protein